MDVVLAWRFSKNEPDPYVLSESSGTRRQRTHNLATIRSWNTDPIPQLRDRGPQSLHPTATGQNSSLSTDVPDQSQPLKSLQQQTLKGWDQTSYIGGSEDPFEEYYNPNECTTYDFAYNWSAWPEMNEDVFGTASAVEEYSMNTVGSTRWII